MNNPLSSNTLRSLMRDIMTDEGWTQAQFAERCGISEAYLSDILNDRREPGEKLLQALGLRRVVQYEMDEQAEGLIAKYLY